MYTHRYLDYLPWRPSSLVASTASHDTSSALMVGLGCECYIIAWDIIFSCTGQHTVKIVLWVYPV